jgi:hypothetical protein
MWMVGYHHIFYFPIKKFIKIILDLVLYKTYVLVLKFKSPLLKPIYHTLLCQG